MGILDSAGERAMFDIKNFSNLSSAQVIVEKGSSPSRFTMYVLLPAHQVLTGYADEGLRGVSPIQEGGRFLYYDTITIGNESISVMLTLHEGSYEGAYRVAGELSGSLLPARLSARLAVGQVSYEAEASEGKIEFHDVVFPEDINTIWVKLETPDDHADQANRLQ